MIAMQRSGNGIRGDRCNESPRGEVCLSTETEAHEVVLLPGSGTYKTRSGPGSPTSHSALPAPLPFPFVLWGLRPVCLEKGTGVRSSRNRTFVQFGLDTLKSPV